MTFRDVWAAALASAMGLVALAALAFGAVTASVALADHAAIAKAIAAAPPADVGLPLIDARRAGFLEGYYPDCAGLSLLLGEGAAASPVVAAIRAETILPDPTSTICQDLQRALTGDRSVTWFTYARYWHGALLLHRLILSGSDYATLKRAAGILIVACALLLAAAVASRFGWASALVLLTAILGLTDIVAVSGLPLQAVCYAAMLASSAAFVRFGAGREGQSALVAAALAGGVYNFFDFFCNPETLALLCAWSWAAAGIVRGRRPDLVAIALVFAAALGGYGGFWALKWIIAAAYGLAGGDLYIFNAGDFGRWAAGGQASWWPGAPTLTVVLQTFDDWWKTGVALALAAATVVLGRGRLPRGAAAALLLPVGLALLGLEAIAGHTMVHPAITFRAVPISFGLLLASLLLFRQTTVAARKPAIAAAS